MGKHTGMLLVLAALLQLSVVYGGRSSAVVNIFNLLDGNHNTYLEWEEWSDNALIGLAEGRDASGHTSVRALKQLQGGFRTLDQNADGILSLDEFLASVPTLAFDDSEVEQVHLALTSSNQEMIVMWVTADNTSASEVQVGVKSGSYTSSFYGTTSTYNVGVLGGWHKFIHTVRLTGLSISSKYFYKCGDAKGGYSREYSFSTPPPATAPVVYAMVADMGTYMPMGYAVCKQVTEDFSKYNFAMVVHAGDIAYAGTGAKDEIEEVWDVWGGLVEPFAALTPYMVAIGNHEEYYNATSFKHRFLMPGNENGGNANLWYSIDNGNVHWIFFSTQDTYTPGSPQYQWLQRDLAAAQSNRNKVAWIIFVTHRPMYCSDTDEWGEHHVGGPIQVALEPLLVQYQVDMFVCGHMHMYERIHPLINGTVVQSGNTYKRPQAPMHVVQGTAGIFTDHDFVQPQPPWSAVRNGLHGYGKLTVYNNTALQFEFMSQETRVSVDEFWILK